MAEKRCSKEPRRQRGVYLPYLGDIRGSRMLTQERLGALAGCSRETIYRLENGRRGADYCTAWMLAGVEMDSGGSSLDSFLARPLKDLPVPFLGAEQRCFKAALNVLQAVALPFPFLFPISVVC